MNGNSACAARLGKALPAIAAVAKLAGAADKSHPLVSQPGNVLHAPPRQAHIIDVDRATIFKLRRCPHHQQRLLLRGPLCKFLQLIGLGIDVHVTVALVAHILSQPQQHHIH